MRSISIIASAVYVCSYAFVVRSCQRADATYRCAALHIAVVCSLAAGLALQMCCHYLAGKTERAAALLRRASTAASERPRLADMQADQAVLLAELRRCYGSLGYLPTRKDLREANRYAGLGCAFVAMSSQISEHVHDVHPGRNL